MSRWKGVYRRNVPVVHGMQEVNGSWEFVLAQSSKGKRCQVVFCRGWKKKGYKACAKCLQRRWRLNHPDAAAFAETRDRARRSGVEFSLTFEQFLSEAGPEYIARRGRGNGDLQLDRIDPARGYVPGNIRPLVGILNRAKSDKAPEEWAAEMEGLPF